MVSVEHSDEFEGNGLGRENCEYGIRIKARSKATQTFTLQMSGFGSYLPTARAQAAGSYSAIPQSNIIGPEGGQMLVDKTVEIINELWK